MIRFEIVPFKEFEKSAKKCGFTKDEILEAYSNIKIPTRSTKGSAGYDFYMPFEIELEYFEDKYIPTGIRCHMDDDVCLLLVPKSGLGCKYGMGMENTIGVVDSDYYHADNYGQIHAMMKSKYPLTIKQGQKFMQGILINYLKTDNDSADGKRTGGFGSTGDFENLWL